MIGKQSMYFGFGVKFRCMLKEVEFVNVILAALASSKLWYFSSTIFELRTGSFILIYNTYIAYLDAKIVVKKNGLSY